MTGPGGSPAGLSLDFAGQPASGESITIELTLPDGSRRNVKLTATDTAPAGAGQFMIGANANDTAINFHAALSGALSDVVATELPAASAMAAANNFFADPPQRVDGPPFDSATALIDGSANTVTWYVGEDGVASARTTASARIAATLTVNCGMRASEEALRLAIQNVAVFAAVTVSPSDPNAQKQYTALSSRVGDALNGAQGQQKVADIEAEIAAAQTSFVAVKERHTHTSNMLTDLLQSVEGAPKEEVGAQILSLQTSLQASLQTTALLSKLSLVNFL